MARSLSAAVLCVLLVGTAVLPGVLALPVGGAAGTEATRQSADTLFTQPERFGSSTFAVEVHSNGSALWTFTYFTDALNASEQDQFREYARRFESEDTDLWTNFQSRAAALTAAGTNATSRNMTARNFRRSASLNDVGNRGVVTMSFHWREFAEVRDDTVVVADVFEGVFYIGPNQWLVFESGPGLRFVPDRITPDPDALSGPTLVESDTLTYYGEQQFPDNTPRIVLTSDTATETAGSGGGPVTSTTDAPGTAGGLPAVLLGVAVLLVGLGAVVAWRADLFGSGDAADPTESGGGSTGGGAAAESAPATDAATDADPPVSGEELLTDEDRVVRLLEDRGGRMKQANIVEETGWSKSKVSMLLSDMEDDGEISKLRVGRENIVSLSGHEPDAAGSPFDDED